MPTLLAIGVSPRYDYSTSRKLTALFVEKWRAAHPGGQVIDRDLIKTPICPSSTFPGSAAPSRLLTSIRRRAPPRSRCLMISSPS